jgi:hypothetical protein
LVAESEGDIERAQTMNERALAIREAVGDEWAICVSQNNLGMIALLRQDFAEAQTRFESSMRLATEVGDRWVVAVGHHNLGNAFLGLHEPEAAREEFVQALQSYEDYGDTWSIALLVEDMILLALAVGELVPAAEMLGAADALRERLEAPRTPAVTATLDAAFASAPANLGAEVEHAANSRGRNLTSPELATLLRAVGRPATS